MLFCHAVVFSTYMNMRLNLKVRTKTSIFIYMSPALIQKATVSTYAVIKKKKKVPHPIDGK